MKIPDCIAIVRTVEWNGVRQITATTTIASTTTMQLLKKIV